MSDQLSVTKTPIQGMYVIDLVVHDDSRGWFKESYQRQKMEELGLPHFETVQSNFCFNASQGTTRGLHAEPWEKYISLATGKVFSVWVDLRKGTNFGQVFTMEITPDKAVFVPRGVANGYQTMEDNTVYTYLVNDHWSPKTTYIAVNLFDHSLNIDWPINQDQAIVSDRDKNNPLLTELRPMEF